MTGRAMHLSLGLLVVVVYTGPAVAQAPRAQPAFPSFHASMLGGTSSQQPSAWLVDASKRTYWLEGGAIGAVVLGVTGFLVENAVASSTCSDTGGAGCHDYRTAAVVGGAALGFLVGALIGRGHAKAAPVAESAPD